MGTRAIKGMRAFDSNERRIMRRTLIIKYGAFCQICKAKKLPAAQQKINMDVPGTDLSFSFDHIVALADGGKNEISNMWPTHIVCNERKGSVSKGSRRLDREARRAVNRPSAVRLAYSSVSG